MDPSASQLVPRPERLDGIDLLRGTIMIVMALDHVRDFVSDRLLIDPTDLTKTTPALFLTRWITHYCAPTFIFLAGTGAFLAGTRGKSKRGLSWFLFTRGLWLAIFEITINRALWMFNYDLHVYGAGVFWAIGLSMIVLAALVYLPTPIVAAFGLMMIGYHNLLDGIQVEKDGPLKLLWVILHSPNEVPIFEGSSFKFGTGYCLIPWAGVMAAGYGFGAFFRLDRPTRQWWFAFLGLFLIVNFVLLRALNIYGDPRPWERQVDFDRTVLSFINCTKYPPSLLYLLMTFGPAILALSIFDRPLGVWSKPIITFGRVPFFFYLLHIPLIHGLAIVIDRIRFGWSPQATAGPWELSTMTLPPGYGVGLAEVYGLWILVVLLLYLPCRWFAGVKARNKSAWLSYA